LIMSRTSLVVLPRNSRAAHPPRSLACWLCVMTGGLSVRLKEYKSAQPAG